MSAAATAYSEEEEQEICSSRTYVKEMVMLRRSSAECQGPTWDQEVVVLVVVLAISTYFPLKLSGILKFLGQERAIDSFVLKKFLL